MATKTIKLTPYEVNHGSEGGLDITISGGVSAQRSVISLDVAVPTDGHARPGVKRKLVSGADGATYSDSTFPIWSDLAFFAT